MSAADGCCRNASNVKYRVSLLWTSVLPRPNDLRDKTTFVPEPPGLAAEQVVEVHDTPWPTLNRGVRDVLVRPPRTPHKVNVEELQAFHNVSVWADVEVLEAAVVASKDELEARCDDGPDGAVEHAPKGAEVGHVNTMWSIPTSQLHWRHCVGRILPVPMYQISDATFVTGILRTRFHVTSDQSGCFIKCDSTHFGESRISESVKCRTPQEVNGSWISGDGKIAQLHALLSLPSTTREGASGGAAMVRATKMDLSADSLWVADLTPQSGAIRTTRA